MISKAFSLIELMVVIAIVALLAAVAVPSYKDYMSRAKLSQAMIAFEPFVQQSRLYYNEQGVFPTNAQVGVIAAFPATADDYLVKPYVSFVSFMGDGVGTNDCHFTVLTSYISNYSNDGEYFTNANATTTAVKYYIVDVDGILVSRCQAVEIQNTLPTGVNPLPVCDIDANENDTVAIVDAMCP